VSGWEKVSLIQEVPAGSWSSVQVNCSAGKKPMGAAGWQWCGTSTCSVGNLGEPEWRIGSSLPLLGDVGWELRAINDDPDFSVWIRAVLICATV